MVCDSVFLSERVRQILIHEWDPIGIADVPEAQDEYDSYVAEVRAMLLHQVSKKSIVKHLWRIETDAMGLRGDCVRIEAAVDSLIRLRDSLPPTHERMKSATRAPMQDAKRRLCWHGALLLLLGMLTGLVEAQFTNVRMGLAAHLEGIMNGILLLALASAWSEVRLGPRAHAVAYRTLLYGTYANWGFTTLSAIWGTVGLSPVTAEKLIAAGQSAAPWQENLVLAGFVSVGVAMLTSVSLILWGLRGAARP